MQYHYTKDGEGYPDKASTEPERIGIVDWNAYK